MIKISNIKINKPIKLELSNIDDVKKVHYIFGKNGTGKTTISRELKKLKIKTFIFNNDFIRKYLYIEKLGNDETSTADVSPEQKRNSFNLFLGKEQSRLAKEIVDLETVNKNLIREFNSKVKYTETILNDEINGVFKNFVIPLEIPKTYIQFKKDKNNFETSKKITKAKMDKIRNLKSDFDLIEPLNSLIKKVNLFLNNSKLNDYISKFNDVLDLSDTDKIVYDIHKKASKYEKEEIDWIGTKYKVGDIKNYLKKLSQTKSSTIKGLESYIEIAKNEYKIIISDSHFEKICEHNKDIEKVIRKKFEILDSISFKKKNKLLDEIEEIELLKNSNFIDSFNKIYNNDQYQFINELPKLKNEFREINNNEATIEEMKVELFEFQNLLDQNITKKVNKHLSTLESKHLEIEFNSSSKNNGNIMDITFKNRDYMSELSEGEKSSLSLAYFLAMVENELETIKDDFIIHIDDPFDSNDHFKIDAFSNIKFEIGGKVKSIPSMLSEIEKRGINAKYIISTHNVPVLSSLCRSMINNNSEKHNLAFHDIKKEYLKYIGINEIKVNSNNNKRTLNKIDLGHIYPIESNIMRFLENELKDILECGINDDNIGNLKVICLNLIKLYDGWDRRKRNAISLLVPWITKGFENIANKDKINTALSEVGFASLSHVAYSNLVNNIKKPVKVIGKLLNFEGCEDSEKLKNYMIKIQDIINDINSIQDEEVKLRKLKRLRHKNNYHFSIVGYAIEE